MNAMPCVSIDGFSSAPSILYTQCSYAKSDPLFAEDGWNLAATTYSLPFFSNIP